MYTFNASNSFLSIIFFIFPIFTILLYSFYKLIYIQYNIQYLSNILTSASMNHSNIKCIMKNTTTVDIDVGSIVIFEITIVVLYRHCIG